MAAAVTDRCAGGVVFGLSVRECVFRASLNTCVRACILSGQYLTNQWTAFHQAFVNDTVEAIDEGQWVKVKVTVRSNI